MHVRGEKVTVVGLGQTALAVVKLLLREGAKPFVTEAREGEKLAAYCRELDELAVPYECGGHTDAAFEGAICAIPSPGVPPDIALLARARSAGTSVLGEMEFAYRYCHSRVLAVTGTNGKTTATELLRRLVDACGRSVLLAGNNACPLSAAVMVSPAPEFIVVEVSSYQLETARAFRPWIAAVLNVSADHLARHQTMAQYADVKARIFAAQGTGDVAVLNADDQWVRDMTVPDAAARRTFSLCEPQQPGLWVDGDTIREGDDAVAQVSDVPLPGRHNLQNTLGALTMMRAGGFDWERTLAGLRAFKGVEHRIEHVADIGGVRFYNDSKSTNIDSLRVALDSFASPVVLIAGGEGKGADYRVLRDLIRRRVKRLITIGQDAPLLEEAFGDLVATERAADMDDAVARSASAAAAGDVVLLSPACASFDMYENFEHRGRAFKESVQEYRKRGASSS